MYLQDIPGSYIFCFNLMSVSTNDLSRVETLIGINRMSFYIIIFFSSIFPSYKKNIFYSITEYRSYAEDINSLR